MNEIVQKIIRTTSYMLLIISVLVFVCGCGRGSQYKGRYSYEIFCLDRDENTHRTYSVYTDTTDKYKLVDELLTAMSNEPSDVKLVAAIRGFAINSYELSDSQLTIDVTEDYRKLSPTTEILVRGALVRTMCQIKGVNNVVIKVLGTDLCDALGNTVGLMNASMFVDNAGNEINSYERIKISLYFAGEDGKSLVRMDRTLEYNTNISTEKLVVEQLLSGPVSTEAKSTINPQTEIINVTIKDGTGYVSLSSHFLDIPEGVEPQVAVYSIVNSLTALPGVNKVQISIDGETNVVLSDGLNLDTMFERNLELVK